MPWVAECMNGGGRERKDERSVSKAVGAGKISDYLD
jgi:hypothetical protein